MLENIEKLRNRVKNPILILGESDLRYYTGIPIDGALLIDGTETLLTHDKELAQNCSIPNIVRIAGRTRPAVLNLLKERKIKKVALDLNSLSYEAYKYFQAKRIKLVNISKTLSEIRMIKSEEEIYKIKAACALADKAMKEVAGSIKAGMTERQVRNIALSVLPQAEDVAFSFIIASGSNSEYTHFPPSERRIALNDMIIVDLGFRVDGYCSDLTRTFCLNPTAQQKKFYDYILDAQRLAIDLIHPDIPCSKLYSKVEDFFRKEDLLDHWKYGLGHGVGLDIHEPPSLSKDSKDKLKNGMTFTIEPGLHISGFGGARVEDTVLLDRHLKKLTESDYSLEL